MAQYKKWLTKYRPTSLDGYVFSSDELETTVRNLIEKRSTKPLLFSGHHGTGKTALVHVIKDELQIEDFDYLQMNSSEQNSVQVFRNEVRAFAESAPMGDIKMCFLDEADGLTEEAQKLLRGFIDEFDDRILFVMTCNYPHKISAPLRESRLREFAFNSMDKDKAAAHLSNILDREGITYQPVDVAKVVEQYYPDMRAVISWAEEWSITGTLVPHAKHHEFDDVKTLFHHDLHKHPSKWIAMRDILIEQISSHEGWEDFFRYMYTECIPEHPNMDDNAKRIAYTITAEHLFKMNFMKSLPELAAVAYLIALSEM